MLLSYKTYQEFKSRNANTINALRVARSILMWCLFISITLLQIYFNVVPFNQAVQNTGQVVNADLGQFFNTSQNIFYNDFLIKIFIDLFDIIFISSAIAALWGTWVLSQGRSIWEAFVLFLTLALPKARKEWGMIYNQVTGKPVEFVTVKLYGKTTVGRVFINQTVSDLDGSYRIYLPDAYSELELQVSASNFEPLIQTVSHKLGETDYYGKVISLKPLKSNTNARFNFREFKVAMKKPTIWLVFLLSTIVTIHSLYGVLAIPQIDTAIFILMYGIAWLWNINVILFNREKVNGKIVGSADNKPIVAAFVQLYNLDKQLLATEVTNKFGLVNFKIDPGKYLAKVSRVDISTKEDFLEVEVDTKGYLKQSIKVELQGDMSSGEVIPSPFG